MNQESLGQQFPVAFASYLILSEGQEEEVE